MCAQQLQICTAIGHANENAIDLPCATVGCFVRRPTRLRESEGEVMRTFTIILATAAVVLAVGCMRTAPPAITVGTTTCAADGNVIKDVAVASVARSKANNSEKAFEGTRCLLKTIPGGDEWQVWFHEAEGSGWIEGKKANFVLERRDHVVRDVLAFPDKKSASAFAKKDLWKVGNGRDEIVDSYEMMRRFMEEFGDREPGGM
jgi:hypothetical protein